MKFFGKKDKGRKPVDDAENADGAIDLEKPAEEKAAKESKGKKGKGKEKPAKAEEYQVQIPPESAAEISYIAMVAERTTRQRLARMLAMSMLANFILVVVASFTFYWAVLYKKDVYFATTPDGRIQELVPLSEPYISISGVSNWAAQAVCETYSLDFRDWRKTLARVREFYSDAAWKELETQIDPLIESIEKERLVLVAVADEAPRLIHKGLYKKGLYAWKLEFPMTLTHHVLDGTVTFRWNVQVLVGRANVAEKKDGVEILQFVISPRK